jgi:hypothetical protein
MLSTSAVLGTRRLGGDDALGAAERGVPRQAIKRSVRARRKEYARKRWVVRYVMNRMTTGRWRQRIASGPWWAVVCSSRDGCGPS